MFGEKQKYYDEYETFCYQNCVRQVLEYYKVDNAFLYINACLSIVLEVKGEWNYSIYFDERAYGVMPCVSQNVIRKNDDRASHLVWKENKKYIEDDYPIIITVDSYYLKHLPFYQKSHGRHCMIAVGEENNKPIIIDWNEPWYYKGEIELEEFFQARNSQNEADGGVFSGDAIRNNWAVVEKHNWKMQNEVLINDFLEGTKLQYKHSSKRDIYYGIDAYLKLMDILENIKSIDDVESRKRELKQMYNALYWSVKKKVFFNFYLHQIIEKRMISSDYTVVYYYSQELSNEWAKFLNFILKHSFIGSDNSIEKIKGKLSELIEKEKYLGSMIMEMHL